MTNSYDVDHGLSQDAPGPLEPVEIAQQPGAAPATGNTARDQEMYAAGIRTGEENAKHNAAIRAGAGWLPIESAPKDSFIFDGLHHYGTKIIVFDGSINTARWWRIEGDSASNFIDEGGRAIYPTHWMPLPAAPGVSTVEDERQAFEAWAKRKKMPLARIGQQYDDFWVDHAWNGWQARAALDAPAAGDALEWQGLTKAELASYVGAIIEYGTEFVAPLYSVVESIEKRLREKNTASQQQEG
ncbi:hypothetical protein [Achromobacter sp. CSND-B12]|uniref:hypothetical protein n=1 Tax=Achromobacter sp. CSND-B12 TaxID=3462570 RepID=UPI00406A6460